MSSIPVPILALDVASRADALDLLDRVGPQADFVKVGLELFLAEGPSIVREIRNRGPRVFLDLKLHDIPNTVGRAVSRVAALDVDLLTVHAAGGEAMLSAAAAAADGTDLRIVAVTVLTSLDGEALARQRGQAVDTGTEARRLAELAAASGCAGVVSSVHEVAALRSTVSHTLLFVTPGIRFTGDPAGDQRRIATPAEAVGAGADYLVVGRSVTASPDPADAFRRVLNEMRGSAPMEVGA